MLELITKYYSNEKTKENVKHLSSNMCYWNLDTNTWNILYSSWGAISSAVLGAVGKILSWNSHQSLQRIYLTGHQQRLCGHTHSTSLAADYFGITEANILSGVSQRTETVSWFLAWSIVPWLSWSSKSKWHCPENIGTLWKEPPGTWLPAAVRPLCPHKAAHLCSLPALLWCS